MDGTQSTTMNRRLFPVYAGVAFIMFGLAPLLIAWAPYESTMGLVQKIFYFHVPAWIAMFLSVFVCGVASALVLFKGKASADRLAVASAELSVLFGAMGLMTGPLWGIKAWGVWWQWDARLTLALVLEMIFIAYMILRAYGGPGSEKLSAGLALFGMANVPFVYISVNLWRTLHPKTTVVPTLVPGMFGAFWWSMAAFLVLFLMLLAARTRLEEQRAHVEALYQALED
jgi:heme exporter protein C